MIQRLRALLRRIRPARPAVEGCVFCSQWQDQDHDFWCPERDR